MLPALPDRYHATRRIGEGATAIVWQAEDRLLSTQVAVKIVKSNLALHRKFRARFAREVALSTRIVHPNVVPVHDSGVLPTGEPFVVLGYASKGSLSDLFKLRPSISEVLRLIDEVLDALGAIHARRLVHQDLKPANVLLVPREDERVHAWVADLGVADALAELNRDRTIISGTPPYMAPEQLMSRTQDLGPWTDLYAVGLILYETLYGAPPHPGEGRHELLEARLKPPPVPPAHPEVPEALALVVQALLDPEPRQRFDRAADVRHALADAIAGVSFQGRVRTWRIGEGTSALTGPILPDGDAPLSTLPMMPLAGTLTWNRVPVPPMAAEPPPERGWGAPARASLGLFALREVPLVGRERERQLLWDAARQVVTFAAPRVVLIVGERGSGRTHLVESIAHVLEEGGWMEVVRLLYHNPPGVDDGYRGAVRDLLVPWNDTAEGMTHRLTRWISRDTQQLPTNVQEEAATLTRWCGYLREGESPPNEATGLTYLYRHLDARAWRGGSCLLLEDVHNANSDGDGLAIAEALLDHSVGVRPVLVLATVSAEAVAADPRLAAKLESLQERGALRIGLKRLNLTETRRVIEETLKLDPEIARLVSLEYEGNPLAAGLLLREWAARQLLILSAQKHYTLVPEVSLAEAIPHDLPNLLLRRLDAAIAIAPDPAAAEEALAATALAGQEPPTALIRSISEAGLDALLSVGLLSEQHGYLVFEHAQLRDVAVERSRTLPGCASIHLRLADAWEKLGGSSLDVDLPRGMHRLKGGDPGGALGPLLAAVRRMIQGGRARAAIRVGVLAIEAADRVGHPGARLEARRFHATALLETGEPERALSLVDHALTEIEADRLARSWLRVLRARCLRRLGDLEGAARELDSAYTVYSSLGDRDGLIAVASQRARLARAEGQHELEKEAWSHVLRMAYRDRLRMADAQNGLVEALVACGNLDVVDPQLERLQRLVRQSGDARRMAESTCTQGLVHLRRKQMAAAEHALKAAAALAATLGAERAHLRARSLLAEVYRYRGARKSAEETNKWVARFAGERRLGPEVAAARVQLALLALSAQRLNRVREQVDLAAAALENSPRDGLWLHIGVLRALLAAEAGEERTCRAWWAVARERGLETRYVPDLWVPLGRLVVCAQDHTWLDIAQRASQCVQTASDADAMSIEDEDTVAE